MADAQHFVRDDVRAFLDLIEQLGRPGVEELPVAEGRQAMAALGMIAEAPPRDLAVIKNLKCPGPAGDIPVRLYDTKETREAGPVVLFLHGGGFVIGDLDIYNSVCTEICAQLDLPVVSVDYRLAPEAPFPAAPTIAKPQRAGSPPTRRNWAAFAQALCRWAIAPEATLPSSRPMLCVPSPLKYR